jgi:hypothetical protein
MWAQQGPQDIQQPGNVLLLVAQPTRQQQRNLTWHWNVLAAAEAAHNSNMKEFQS